MNAHSRSPQTGATYPLAILGSGPTAVYLLDHLSREPGPVTSVCVYETSAWPGRGMPYNPETTDVHHLCNFSSVELPALPQSFAEWLTQQPQETLTPLGVVSKHAVYTRLAMGAYFADQLQTVLHRLRDRGCRAEVRAGTPVVDLQDLPDTGEVAVHTADGIDRYAHVVICTGHSWPEPDDVANGHYLSPWPIHKLTSRRMNHPVGLLGASLSAFDVVATLAARHGTLTQERFTPDPQAPDFRIVLHASEGWLPQLQYEQREPMREVYRHVSEAELTALYEPNGRLPLDRYWDAICRPVLSRAFDRDERPDCSAALRAGESMEAFVVRMGAEHTYYDPFEGMRAEIPAARESERNHDPVHYKEVLDDLLYTLNFHAERLSARDHERLRSVLMPYVLNVIAAMPLRSARMLLALHDAGCLDLVAGDVAEVNPTDGHTEVVVERGSQRTNHAYDVFIDCRGQAPVDVKELPFPSLLRDATVRPAWAPLSESESCDGERMERDGVAGCVLHGLDIDPHYRVIGADGRANPRIQDAAFPHAMGLRPYSFGLQACEATARFAVHALGHPDAPDDMNVPPG